MRKFLAALAVFILAVFTVDTAHAIVEVDGRYWFTNLSSEIQSGTTGTNVNFTDDLGLDDSKGFFEGRISLGVLGHRVRYGFMPMKWDGSGTTTQSVTFGGQTYSASTAVDSEINVKYHRLGYIYNFIDVLNNRLGIIVEAKYLDIDAKIKSSTVEATESIGIPIPTVGVTGQVGLPFLFSVGGEVTGIALGKDAYLYDAEAGVNIKPAPFVLITGGYRVFRVHYEGSNDKADIRLNGPFLNVRADF